MRTPGRHEHDLTRLPTSEGLAEAATKSFYIVL